jgi:hypothetical protein
VSTTFPTCAWSFTDTHNLAVSPDLGIVTMSNDSIPLAGRWVVGCGVAASGPRKCTIWDLDAGGDWPSSGLTIVLPRSPSDSSPGDYYPGVPRLARDGKGIVGAIVGTLADGSDFLQLDDKGGIVATATNIAPGIFGALRAEGGGFSALFLASTSDHTKEGLAKISLKGSVTLSSDSVPAADWFGRSPSGNYVAVSQVGQSIRANTIDASGHLIGGASSIASLESGQHASLACDSAAEGIICMAVIYQNDPPTAASIGTFALSDAGQVIRPLAGALRSGDSGGGLPRVAAGAGFLLGAVTLDVGTGSSLILSAISTSGEQRQQISQFDFSGRSVTLVGVDVRGFAASIIVDTRDPTTGARQLESIRAVCQ